MSKIICDVCGTAYQDTAAQCPVCGCVHCVGTRSMPPLEVSESKPASGGYNYVKGGRFSKSNVRKRNNAKKTEPLEEKKPEVTEEAEPIEKKQTDKGLIVAFVVLLFSVLAMLTYILLRFLAPNGLDNLGGYKPDDLGGDHTIATEADESVACQDITFEEATISFVEIGQSAQIVVNVTPEDTTDEIAFTSDNEQVATVNAEGIVTAVSAGEAKITVQCGEVMKTVAVSVTVQADPNFKLNRTEFTLFSKGETWSLNDGSIAADVITWSTSDEKVATVEDGVVTAVSTGNAVITAEYNGAKLECTVYCSDSVGAYVDPSEQKTYSLNTDDHRKNDITIYVGNSYTIKLLDENENVMDATFTTSNKNICSVSSSGRVTGKSAGKVTITATYDNQTFTCIVRVRAQN